VGHGLGRRIHSKGEKKKLEMSRFPIKQQQLQDNTNPISIYFLSGQGEARDTLNLFPDTNFSSFFLRFACLC
jgi:hypothetical protein